MRTILSFLACAFLIVGTIAITTGCANRPVPAQVRAGQSLETVARVVNLAMNTYGELYRADKLSPATVTKVRKLYADYQTAADIANKAIGNDQAVAPEDIVKLATELTTFIASLK